MVLNKLMKLLKKKKVIKKNIRKSVPKKKAKANKITKKKAVKISKRIRKPQAQKEKLIAEAIHYFSKIKVAILKMKGELALNDKIHVKGHTTDFTQNITSMQINHQSVNAVHKGQEIGILVKGKVRHKDKVYKVG